MDIKSSAFRNQRTTLHALLTFWCKSLNSQYLQVVFFKMATTEALSMINDTNVAAGSGGLFGETVRILTTFLCVILNTMVLVVIKHQNDLQEHMRILYQVLAVANMLLGISWSIWAILWFTPDKTKEFCTSISVVCLLSRI